MSWLKALATQTRGLLQVCQSYLRCMVVEALPQLNVSNQLAKSGQTMLDAPTQPLSAPQKSKGKRLVAQQDTQVKSRKKTLKTAPTDKLSGQGGSQQVIRAEKSPQGLSSKHSVALSTTQELLSSNVPLTIKPKATRAGKTSVTLVSKTPRHAKPAKKAKP